MGRLVNVLPPIVGNKYYVKVSIVEDRTETQFVEIRVGNEQVYCTPLHIFFGSGGELFREVAE